MKRKRLSPCIFVPLKEWEDAKSKLADARKLVQMIDDCGDFQDFPLATAKKLADKFLADK